MSRFTHFARSKYGAVSWESLHFKPTEFKLDRISENATGCSSARRTPAQASGKLNSQRMVFMRLIPSWI
jgi:hypothetical protein